MARTKWTARKRVIMPNKRTRFTLGKRVPPHLVEALRDMEEDPQEEQTMDVPMDEDAEEEVMIEEPVEDEETEEEPMEQDEQEGAGDPDDGDSSDSSDSSDHGSGGDDGDGDGDSQDHHAALLAKGWTVVIHFNLHGDAYYHPKLLTLARRFHARCTVQYRTEHWTHPDYIGFWETEAYIREGSRVCHIHRAITARTTRAAAIRDAARQALVVNRDRHFADIAWEEDRYLPRRRSGQTICNIAAPLVAGNPRIRPTLACLAQTNTDLDRVSDELDALRKAYLELAVENSMLKQQQGNHVEEVPLILAESPLRNHEDPNTGTNLDP
jgi:hypothetical protein